jgi:sugar/nucleoside kinase (ribokinase family)
MTHRGLFVGLTTLDLMYGVAGLPQANEKQVATDLAIAAGGPATNAAVAFRHLGNQAVLLSAVGQHPLVELVRSDLGAQQVELRDLASARTEPPPLSSILVTQSTGDRAVVSRNAVDLQVSAEQFGAIGLASIHLETMDIILVDGHQMAVSVAIAQRARQCNIPVVLDGGSWKPGLEALLPWIDYAICSANFLPPGCTTTSEVLPYLMQSLNGAGRSGLRSPCLAITHGGQPIEYVQSGQFGKVSVPVIQPVDTLGAGDIFHGAFCHAILQTSFVDALQQAAAIAALSCQSFGTREWLQALGSV